MEKMTYVVALTAAIEDKGLPTEVRERLADLRGTLEKKNASRPTTPKANPINDALRDKVLDVMAFGSAYRVSDIAKLDEAFADLSTQKMTALLRTLKSMGLVTQFKVKGDSFYERVGE